MCCLLFPIDQLTHGDVFYFFVATVLEDGEIGEEFEQVGVIGGFQMLENSSLYEYNLLRKLSLQ